jgi:hypothetical protein
LHEVPHSTRGNVRTIDDDAISAGAVTSFAPVQVKLPE